MEGYEDVAALGEGDPPPQRRLYSRGAPLKPALVVLEVEVGLCVTPKLYLGCMNSFL